MLVDKLIKNTQPTQSTQSTENQNQTGGLTGINNLFHFLLLDKINMKKEVKDKLIKVYEIFSSKSLGTRVEIAGSDAGKGPTTGPTTGPITGTPSSAGPVSEIL